MGASYGWIATVFRPILGPKYSLLQEEPCPHCGIHDYHDSKRPRNCNNKLFLLGLLTSALVSLFFAGLGLLWSQTRSDHDFQAAHYPADNAFGKVPTVDVVFEPDPAFINSDPLDGRWDGNLKVLNGDRRTPWDELYLSPWTALSDPSAAGVSEGVPLKQFSDDPTWSASSQAFVPSILHQLHCVGIIKHGLVRFEEGDSAFDLFEDTTHCVEYLRQTLMCHGDLTLEKPRFVSDVTFGGPTGWGTAHQCRDWSTIHSFISEHTVFFSGGKPVLWKPDE